MSIDNDKKSLGWLLPGSGDELLNNILIGGKVDEANVLSILEKITENFKTFYVGWNKYFTDYAKFLGNDLIKKIEYNSQFITGYIDYQKPPKSKEDALEKIKSWMLFKAQSVPKWFYGCFCDIYNHISEMVLKKKDFIDRTSKTCKTFDISTVHEYGVFMEFPNIDKIDVFTNTVYDIDLEKLKKYYNIQSLKMDTKLITAIIIIAIILLIVSVYFIIVQFKFFKTYTPAAPRQKTMTTTK